MPSSFRDPKTLADWIQLDYFLNPGRLWRTRNLVTWLVFIACLAVIAFTTWPVTHFIYESRPVSSAHAMFNDNCGVCHVESFQPLKRLVRGESSVRSVSDDTCRVCHPVGAHHEEDARNANCSTCHQEHRGRPVLARVADSHCTVCHADLNIVGGSRTGFATTIHGFTTNHPPFGSWKGEQLVDCGTIRFNHKVHLRLKPETIRGIHNPLVARQDPEQRCIYCHKADAAGRYMRSINYDRHCSQCHALSVRVVTNEGEEKVRAAAERFAQEPAPHKDSLTVRATLRERYTRFVQENPAVLGSQKPTEPPRWVLGQPRVQPVTDKEWLWVSEQLQTAERIVFYGANGCGYCHKMDAARGPGNLPGYLPSGITSVRFPHSVFSHERHRMLRCTECHADDSRSPTKDRLLPTINDCRKCHDSQVGARTDCAECHRYHDRAKEVLQGQKSILDCIEKQ